MSGSWQDPIIRMLATKVGAIGTGILVQSPQYGPVVLTAAHVINEAFAPERSEYSADRPDPNVRVAFDVPLGGGGRHEGRVIEWAAPRPPELRARYPVTDVALLEVLSDGNRAPSVSTRALKPEDFEALTDDELEGRSIRCFGFPDRAGEGRHATGRIQGWGGSGLLHLVANDDRGYFITPGFSGAPVFDERGQKVLAMAITMDADQEKRLALAVPTRLLWRACPELALPYRGLKVFEEEDAEFFFGREAFTAALLKKAETYKIFGVTAASGAGKSSAIRAGLLPKLKKLQSAVVLVMRPYDDPWKQLAEALVPRLFPADQPGERPGRVRQKAAELRTCPSVLSDDARTILDEAGGDRLVIFVDQFEELFTTGDSNADAGSPARFDFRDLMVATAGLSGRAGAPKLQWLYVLRGDFADRAFRHRSFKDAVGDGNEFLADMTDTELREAIRKPAATLDVEFEGGTLTQPGLVERIARDAGATVGSLPLMQHVLEKLWEGMRERRLTHKAYEGLGEIKGALDRHADAVFAVLMADEQLLVPRLFSRLVNLKEDGEATRRAARRQELDPALWELAIQLATEVERANHAPVTSRLLAISGGAKAKLPEADGTISSAPIMPLGLTEPGETPIAHETAEIAHEALLKYWRKLRDWISEQKDFLLWRDKLDRRIGDWEEYKNSDTPPASQEIPPEYLLHGRHLIEATNWWESRSHDLDRKQATFIERSMEAAKREEQRLAKERQEKADAIRRQEELESELRKLQRYTTPLGRPIFDFGAIERFATETFRTPAAHFDANYSPSANWAIEAIGAHQSPFTGSGVTIGCIETGIDASHPAFNDIVITQKDFSREENTSDLTGHGTATASVILGRMVEGQRIGVAIGVKRLFVAKVGSKGSSDLLIQALSWLYEQDVNIIHVGFSFDFLTYGNMLLEAGTGPQKEPLARVLLAHRDTGRLFDAFMNIQASRAYLFSSGGPLIFAPAGNDSSGGELVPVTSPVATAEGVISVGAVSRGFRGLEAAAFTNLGPKICAPGVDVPVAKLGGGFGAMSGTTLSCAVAVGTAALWWEYVGSRGDVEAVKPQEVAALMYASATKNGFAPGTNEGLLGYGLIGAPSDTQKLAVTKGRGPELPSDDVKVIAPSVPIIAA